MVIYRLNHVIYQNLIFDLISIIISGYIDVLGWYINGFLPYINKPHAGKYIIIPRYKG